MHDLARHRRHAAVLQLLYRTEDRVKQLPEVAAWVRERGGGGARMYAEMPTALLLRILHVLEEGEGDGAASAGGEDAYDTRVRYSC